MIAIMKDKVTMPTLPTFVGFENPLAGMPAPKQSFYIDLLLPYKQHLAKIGAKRLPRKVKKRYKKEYLKQRGEVLTYYPLLGGNAMYGANAASLSGCASTYSCSHVYDDMGIINPAAYGADHPTAGEIVKVKAYKDFMNAFKLFMNHGN